MYLVYESLYGELLYECESTTIVGLYDSKEKAIKKVKDLINAEDLYVLDIERNNLEQDNYVRLFYDYQENWNCYYEIIIKELKINKDYVNIAREELK